MMEHICYFNLVTYSKVGGIENFNKFFLRALDSLEYKVISVSVYDTTNDEEFRNVEFKNFNTNKIQASLYILKNSFKIDKLIVAHINLFPIAIIAKILNPKLQIYLSIYGVEVWKKFSYFYRFFLNKIKIISISSYTTDIFIKLNKVNIENIQYLPPCINIDIADEFSNVYTKTDFNVLSVSRLDSNDNYKGIDSLIKSIPSLIEQIPNLKYTIIGKGNDKKRLEKLAKKLNVGQYIDFKGFVEHIDPYYKYCDIFVLPSKGEGFGIVYIEAMKFKKACIACDEGGQVDIVINGKNGFLCPYADIQCLVNKIIDLNNHKEKRIKFGENGYQYIIENFTFKSFKDRLKGILQ